MENNIGTVFIVDDDPAYSGSLTRLLNALGILADGFGSAVQFLDSVPSGQKGIAIVHIHMPVCDGFWLMVKMRDLHYRMPVILTSIRSEGDTRRMAIERGAVGFLKKPFNEQSLLSLILELKETGDVSP